MSTLQKIKPCLWFDTQGEEAARFYASVFKNSKVGKIARYGKEGYEVHHKKAGEVMTVEFELDGQQFMALNGGPEFKFNEANSLVITCKDQEEVDYFWNKLTQGGEEGPCGWLKDKFGLSWQVVPEVLAELMSDPAKSEKVTKAFMKMKKLDIAVLEKAAAEPVV
jgi:predicted 3-demethylubiquinone-9 3-methyltransferase (glyoxalase superfamily)